MSEAMDTNGSQLSAGELGAMQALLTTQNLLGQGTSNFTASSVLELMAGLDRLSGTYAQLVNPTVQTWVASVFDGLAAANTVYQQKFPALYLVWQVSQFPFDPQNETITLTTPGLAGSYPVAVKSYAPNSIHVGSHMYALGVYGGVYPAFRNRCLINYSIDVPGVFGSAIGAGGPREPWSAPTNPPSWNRTLNALLQSWGESDCPVKLFPHGGFLDYVPKHLAVLNPVSWTDVDQLKTSVADLWATQSDALQQLLGVESLSGQDYFFVLYVLVALRTGDDDAQSLAAQVLRLPCRSDEYPNDVFGNQLVYAALLYVSDPNGAFVWTYQQRFQWAKELRALVGGKDPASTALQESLDAQLRLLTVDSAYPLEDPNSKVVFDQRVTDTLAALDTARRSLPERDE